jgi:uncharacterized protein (DUF983 family)
MGRGRWKVGAHPVAADVPPYAARLMLAEHGAIKRTCPHCSATSVFTEPDEPVARCHLCQKRYTERFESAPDDETDPRP